MSKKFSELRKRMSAESQARVEAKAKVLIGVINERCVSGFDSSSTHRGN